MRRMMPDSEDALPAGLVPADVSCGPVATSQGGAEPTRERLHRLERILDSIADPVFVKDEAHRWVYLNAAYCKFMGYRLQDLLGKTDFDFFPAAEAAVFWAKDEIVFQQVQENENEEFFTDAAGNQHIIVTKKSRYISDSGAKYIVGVIRDVTEQKRAEDLLRRREALLQDSQRTAHMGIWEWDIPGNQLSWTDEHFRLFGHEPGAFQPTLERFLLCVHPDDRARIAQEVAGAVESAKDFALEYRTRLPDGTLRVLEGHGRVTRGAQGQPLRLFGITQDITARKTMEQELRAQYLRLQELDRLKSNFVNAVSHEIRTPLSSVVGFTEFLEDELGGPLTEQQREFVRQLKAGAKRLEYLVNDLLDFARIEAGSFHLRLEQGQLGSRIQEVVDSFLPQIEAAGLVLQVEVKDAETEVPMDSQRIGQVLINLLSNAIKFTGRGGVIRVRAYRSAESMVVEVHDTGVGIAERDLPRLFERFTQLEPGVRQGKGTGLGLSISKAIIDAHRGKIGVRSREGLGSVFWFTLPLSEASDPHDPGRRAAAAPPDR